MLVKRAVQCLVALIVLPGSLVFAGELTVLCYHDIVSDPGDDAYAVSRAAFVQQMDYLESNGYHPVSLQQLNRIYKKQETLPDKAVLITFDDGLISYAKFAAPVLKTYGFPSVLSIVTGWTDNKNVPAEYRGKLLTWDELRTLKNSKLIELISHSHELHTNVRLNPQGNFAPAGVTRIYSPTQKQYEPERVFRQRIAQDLKNSAMRFQKELNLEPIGIAWPYGRYDNVMAVEARLLGMQFQLTLDDGPNSEDDLPILNRIMVMRDTNFSDFLSDLKYEPMRNRAYQFVELKLDSFIGKNEEQADKILSSMLDEVEELEANTLIISPVTEDGNSTFFPTEHMKTAADVLNRVTHQFNSRLGIRYIYLKISGNLSVAKNESILNDMSRLAWFNGVIFDGVDKKDMTSIRKIIEYYHPKSAFGHYGETKTAGEYDFIILPVTTSEPSDEIRDRVLRATGLPTKLFVEVKVDNNDDSSLPGVIDMIKNLGIKHYGVAYKNDLAKETLAVFGG